ncbi:NUDIX domain-containing protein [Nanohaloarchaea archaeon H01]|nr:NUDIX domain-containing protein [Nanohaloarchaea archaeon H01]
MVTDQVSGSLIVRDKNLLMVYDEKLDQWNVPTDKGKKGELSSEAAERIAEEKTGCSCDATKYRSKLKTTFTVDGEEIVWQPYDIEIEGETEDAEWVSIDSIDSKELAKPLNEITAKLKDKL